MCVILKRVRAIRRAAGSEGINAVLGMERAYSSAVPRHCRACFAEIPALERANVCHQVGVGPGWSRCMTVICVSYMCVDFLSSQYVILCACVIVSMFSSTGVRPGRHDRQQFSRLAKNLLQGERSALMRMSFGHQALEREDVCHQDGF